MILDSNFIVIQKKKKNILTCLAHEKRIKLHKREDRPRHNMTIHYSKTRIRGGCSIIGIISIEHITFGGEHKFISNILLKLQQIV